jgi:LPXTG-motif cell wall-anchored protein
MSPLRRILIAGLPAAGLTVAASLALAGSPADAVADRVEARPATYASPCTDADRDKCDYSTPGGAGTVTTGGGTTTPTRGHGGYGTVSPTPTTTTSKPTPATSKPTPSKTTPTAHVDTVPPTSPGVLASETPTPSPTTSGGVSAGHELPLTGTPTGAVVSLGLVLVAAGAGSVWYTRRRRSA